MAFVNPLDQLTNRIAEKEQRAAEMNRPKAEWFSPKLGETVLVQFLQELSPESPNYNGSYGKSPVVLPGQDPNDPDDRYDIGLFLMAKEREAGSGPDAFKSRALCTLESEGKDWAYEMSKKRPHERGWYLKENFYITVAVQRGNKVTAEILKRPIGNSFVKELIEFYNENDQCLTGQTFKISKDYDKSSPWRIRPAKEEIDISDLQPYDLARDAVRLVPYERQEAWYSKNYKPELTEEEQAAQRSSLSSSVAKNDPVLGDDDGEEW